jgi:hypothetical protein
MIRPSMLQLADAGCGLAARLSEEAKEGSTATENGTATHAEIEDAIKSNRRLSKANVAHQLIALMREAWGSATVHPESEVSLFDPDSGELITKGTCDAWWMDGNRLYVVDVKTGLPSFLPDIDNCMQLHAYAMALALEHGAEEYVIGYGLTNPEAKLAWSRVFYDTEMEPILARITRAATRPPTPVVGAHCDGCFQRKRCPSWLLPAYDGESALAPFTKPQGLTKENAARAVLAVGAIETALKIAKTQLQDFARENGGIEADGQTWGPAMRNGRRTISIKDVEEAGKLQELEAAGLVKKSAPYEVFGWNKGKRR